MRFGSFPFDGAAFVDAGFLGAADFFATIVSLEFFDMLSSRDVSVCANLAARIRIFLVSKISWNILRTTRGNGYAAPYRFGRSCDGL